MTCQSDRTSGRDQTRAESSDPCDLPIRSHFDRGNDRAPLFLKSSDPVTCQSDRTSGRDQTRAKSSDPCDLPIRSHFDHRNDRASKPRKTTTRTSARAPKSRAKSAPTTSRGPDHSRLPVKSHTGLRITAPCQSDRTSGLSDSYL